MRRLRKKGFTLVEIMIVVAIIGLLAAIAIPNFVRARQVAQQNACMANLKQIEGSKQVWGLDGNPGTPAWGDLVPMYLRRTPSCPGGGTYNIGDLDSDPICSQAGHALP